MAVVGIDLGTTKSVVAILRGKGPEVIPNREGDRIMPSVVGLSRSGELQVGKKPKENRLMLRDGPIEEVKRLMGTSERVEFGGKARSPQELSAMILTALKEDASAYLGEAVQAAVITIPAYFNEPERRATREAGELAGLYVGAVLDEPTAAAMAYGLGRDIEETILVYDLGGGTFDVSVLGVAENHFEVLGISGNKRLGGKDFDRRVISWIVEKIKCEYGTDVATDRRAMHRLTLAAESCKKELSSALQAPILIEALTSDLDVDLTISRAEFESLIRDYVASTVPCLEEALAKAELLKSEVDRIVLIGGSTRIPMVQKAVTGFFGKEPVRDINPDEAVALGAAIFTRSLDGADLSKGVSRLQPSVKPLVEVTAEIPPQQIVPRIPHALGIRVVGNRLAVIVESNSFYPIEVTKKDFSLARDGQDGLSVAVFEGDNPIASENTPLGEVEMALGQGLRAGTPVWITFKYNASRILEVSVEVPQAGGARATATLRSAADLTPEERERIRKELKDKRGAGMKEAVAQVLAHASKVLEMNRPRLDPTRAAGLEKRMGAVEEALTAGNPELVGRRIGELEESLREIHQQFDL